MTVNLHINIRIISPVFREIVMLLIKVFIIKSFIIKYYIFI